MSETFQFFKQYETALATHTLGRALEWYDEVDSTNTQAKRRLAAGAAADGLAVTAFSQTAGRGRLGHTWENAAGAGLYVSFVTQALPATLLPLVPVACGVAVAELLRESAGCEAGVKWPNDIIVREHKIAGILCEGVNGRGICGIGINLLQDEAYFARAGLPYGTSLLLETGRAPETALLAAGLANHLEPWLDSLERDGGTALLAALRVCCISLGREVRAISPQGELCGRAVDLDGEGRLVIETAAGRTAVSAGEVRLRTARGYL